MYGISVWGNCSVAKLAHLTKIHLSAAKLIFKLPEIPGLLTVLPSSWKPISYLYKLRLLCLTHKLFYVGVLRKLVLSSRKVLFSEI